VDNLAAIRSLAIHRAFSWGAMLDLIITDLRSYRSPPVVTEEIKALIKGAPLPPSRIVKILDAGRTANNGKPPEKISYKDREIANPRRDAPAGTHMGGPQKLWFKAAMKASKARWRIWANSVPALSMRIDFGSLPFAGLEDGYVGIDAWQGYPGELKELMSFFRDEKIGNVISCSGDYHAHIAGSLPVDPDAETIACSAVEFVTAGISSGSMYEGAERGARKSAFFHRAVEIDDGQRKLENFNNTLVNGLRAGVITNYTNSVKVGAMFRNERASPGLSFLDSNAHGFGIATLTEEGAAIELVNVGDVSRDMGPEGAPVMRRSRFSVKEWKGGEYPLVEGPTFEGEPPFPWAHMAV
jgi:alkaline phosphatase D